EPAREVQPVGRHAEPDPGGAQPAVMRGEAAATDDASVLRRSLIGLVVIALAGLTAELLVERHWGTAIRLVSCFALLALAFGALLLMRRPPAAAGTCPRHRHAPRRGLCSPPGG